MTKKLENLMIWPAKTPEDCPLEQSAVLKDIAFTGRYSVYTDADTWYPSWASDGNLYSPWTDGKMGDINCFSFRDHPSLGDKASTGQAKIIGEDPMNLTVENLGVHAASPEPYKGRYPCGTLVHQNIWYYGTYCLGPSNEVIHEGENYNWPWLGPFVGFRISTDMGKTWLETPHTPENALFGENGLQGEPIKIGAPHFVDFGKDMEHSPDGYAYLVAHGASESDEKSRFANLSWITGDQIYLIRVLPSIQNINNPSQYEFFSGHDELGHPIWTNDFQRIQPIVDWNNRCGCVTITYNAPLKKYLMCVTDGWPTTQTMDSYILEADQLTGPWKMVSFMERFGVQAYFLNFPSKFISEDGRTMWLCYSGNFTREQETNPPGGKYAMTLQEIKFL